MTLFLFHLLHDLVSVALEEEEEEDDKPPDYSEKHLCYSFQRLHFHQDKENFEGKLILVTATFTKEHR
jgi:hypothetical protein